MPAHKSGKSGRKIGRHKTRSPAQKRYVTEQRSVKNKLRKIAKHNVKHPKDKQDVGKKPNYKMTEHKFLTLLNSKILTKKEREEQLQEYKKRA